MLREVWPFIERCNATGEPVALATVVSVWGSAPRQAGARMAVADSGGIAGSVSGGCVEGAVVEEARAVLRSGTPRLARYGVSNEDAWAVGLSCGGAIEIFVERVEPPARSEIWAELSSALAAERLVTLATVIAGPSTGRQRVMRPDGTAVGTLGDAELDRRSASAAMQSAAGGDPQRVQAALGGAEVDLFVEALPPRPNLVVVGAVHVAIPLVRFAAALGFRTIVVDPRAAFATVDRFGHADALLVEWPAEAFSKIALNEASCVAVLAHDPKIDVPALSLALRSPARYVGALGSKKTHAKRVTALREAGHSEAEIARIRSPIGLDLGGRSPEEIAIAIAAEIVAAAHGRG